MRKQMNLCFLIGKIVSDIEFKFIINSKNVSISYFKIELNNKSIICVKAYNELADYCYRKLQNGDICFIYGNIDRRMEIVVKQIASI